MDFTGPGTPLTQAGFAAAAADLGPVALYAVLSVETSGCGYLGDRRPKLLFERHVFSRRTGHRFDADDADVSAPTPGGYGASGAHQYDRLQAALGLDADAALSSASWGLGQIMGENHVAAGFPHATAMVTAFVASEDAQIAGMAAFIAAAGMAQALKTQDWARFARLYNGPSYAANNYDGHLAHFYGLYSQNGLPDLTVRAVQVRLMYAGCFPGQIDGLAGPSTTAAVKAYQTAQGLPATGRIDPALMQALEA